MLYAKSKKYNYSFNSNVQSIDYSDGSITEDNLFNILLNTKDKSVLSDELANKIVDWPTEYHFSRSRHCLLKHLPFKKEESVLELGCGCGAITRFLGETGAKVDSVEGTHSRARIAGERCRDLSNVNVYVDDFLNFESGKKYDWVLLIGVLEYAPLFSNEDDAIQHYLRVVRKYLKPEGKLVLAIENKLGLKYFNGCSEDHVNEAFFGLENRYCAETPITFGKHELSEQLNIAGFKGSQYYYPFPDYKLPSIVLSEQALNNGMKVSDLIRDAKSRDYSGRNYRSFDEVFVWPELEKNGLIDDLSNSFLIVSSAQENFGTVGEDIAWYYNINRLSKFVTQTVFKKSGASVIVEKRRINDSVAVELPSKYSIKDLKEEFIDGFTLQVMLEKSWHTSKNIDDLVKLYSKWLSFIIDMSDFDGTKEIEVATISGLYIDITPFNVKLKNNEFYDYDQEWSSTERISLLWVAFRGIYWSLKKFNSSDIFEINILDIFSKVFSSSNINLENEELIVKMVVDLEKDFVGFTTGKSMDVSFEVKKVPCNLKSYEMDLKAHKRDLENFKCDIEAFSIYKENLIEENSRLKFDLNRFQTFLPFRIFRYIKRILK